jgi:hypothetical protein
VFAGIVSNALQKTATQPGTLAHGALSTAFGFLPGCGTIHVLLLVRAIVYSLIHARTQSILLFLDLQKAFDSLNRDRFADILLGLEIELGWVGLVELLHDKTYYTITAFERRVRLLIPHGVRQGSREGPIIFLLIFAVALQRLGAKFAAPTDHTILAYYNGVEYDLTAVSFADDNTLCIPTADVHEFQKIIRVMHEIFLPFGLQLNWDKTKYILVFGPEKGHPPVGKKLEIKLAEGTLIKIERVREVTLVGQRVAVVGGASTPKTPPPSAAKLRAGAPSPSRQPLQSEDASGQIKSCLQPSELASGRRLY